MKNKKTINRVLKLIRPYTYLVVSILVLAAVTVAATLYSPILIGKGVDCMIEKGLVSFPDLKLVLLQLAVVTAIAFSELYGKEIRYCSDRKEEKDHGADKGSFLGSKLKDGDRVVMIEDVTTSGKSMEETVPKVRGAANVEIVGLMVSLDRMEVGKGGVKCALDEVHDLYGFETNAIVTMKEVIEHLYNKEYNGKVVIDDSLKAAIDAYYEQYGAK